MALRWSIAFLALVSSVSCTEDLRADPIPVVFEPSWAYHCIPEEGCERAYRIRDSSVNSSLLFDSIDVCRTVCGRFGGIWPKPVSAAISMQTVKIHPNYLRYDLSNAPAEARELLVKMTHVITGSLLDECSRNVTELSTTPVVVSITVRSTDLDLTWQTDESYLLDAQITKDKSVSVRIVAETVYGARHGLETFTHLVAAEKSYNDHFKCTLRIVSGAKITDKPAFPHRGFMLDTSRNFIPMSDIKRMVDGMATTKMNVFHWHATDSHSFPLESTRVPQFTRYGAYSPEDIYTTEDVLELIEYAKIRGVRVVIEIDAPAHAGNGWQWGKEAGLGDLAVCVNARNWRNHCIQPPCGQLNPANPHMYRVLRDLYRDIAELLPRPALFHMGGDEVFFNCWNTTEEITSYMQGKGMERTREGFVRLWAEFHATALKIWDEELAAVGQGKQPVLVWSSELTQAGNVQKYLNKDRYVIVVWEKLVSPLLQQLIRMGYRVISTPKDMWYLDHGFWGNTVYSNWRRMYSHALPRDAGVLGGEVAMWSEYVDTNSLDARVWPRAAAVAERLWSDPKSPVSAAEVRMQRLRARLIARGLHPDALSPHWCASHDSRCL